MTKKQTEPSPPEDPRFGDLVGDRIEAMRKRHKLTQLAAAQALGVDDNSYRAKCTNRLNRWRFDDVPKLRAWAERLEGSPMPGWPVLDEPQAKALGGILLLARIAGPHVSGGVAWDPRSAFDIPEALRALFTVRSGEVPPSGTARVDKVPQK